MSGRRMIFAALGIVLLPVGVAGLVLPLLPGTPILIASAACFARSSPRLEAWLMEHPRLGPGVRGWRERGAIHPDTKRTALAVMVLSAVLAAVSSAPAAAKVLAIAILAGAAVFVWTRPE